MCNIMCGEYLYSLLGGIVNWEEICEKLNLLVLKSAIFLHHFWRVPNFYHKGDKNYNKKKSKMAVTTQ